MADADVEPKAESAESVLVDVVVVSYNSRSVLRDAVIRLIDEPQLNVIVVDNASTDDSLAAVGGLPVEAIALPRNGGFAHGCNHGWRAGCAPYVLFLNPDARIEPAAIRELIDVLAREERTGLVAPLIRKENGALDFSIRRFPRLISRYAQALFLQRIFPRRKWSDEVVRDPDEYRERTVVEWVSGACLLVRRSLLERVGGWDERFFLYCEDIDLCKRIQEAGFDVVFEPAATVVHTGGASASRPALLPTLAQSRIRFVQKHGTRATRLLERLGIGLCALTHVFVAKGGIETRAGHARSLKVVAGRAMRHP